MESTKNAASKKNILLAILALIAILAAVASAMPQLRFFFNSQNIQTRQILAKTFADFESKKFVVLKIKTESGIDIEIYEKDQDNNQRLKQKFSLIDDTEAFLMINNNSVNLGLNDVDHDGVLDIISPTVDRGGNSRLNIFKYNSELDQFVPLQPTE
jgi:hypothetical protein